MAVALRSAARLKPEIQLSRALQDFESILDQDQKSKFDVFKKESPPGASAPLTFTCLLDRGLENRRSRRCIGPRVINLLQSTQQFSTVIDVFIGGSQNLLASSVWGILKLSLQIGSNYSQYFDKLSMLLMDVGRTCPQYQEFGTLFAESKGLQRALCEYFAAIIGLCKHIVLFSRKPFIAQLPKLVLPFDATFSEIQSTLRRLSGAVRDEVALASSKHQKEQSALNAEERKESSNFRALAARFKDQSLSETRRTNKQYVQHLRSDFLNKLTHYNHVTTWKQARSKGSVRWILENDSYVQWKSGFAPGTLRLIGNLGSGKTVLVANVVADLALQKHVTVGYFFCRFNDAESLKARTVIGSLARQLLSDIEFHAPEIISNVADVDDLVEFLLNVLSCNTERKSVICLDGLDECEQSERDQILSALGRMSAASKLNLKIFYSARPDSIQATGSLLDPYDTISMSGIAKGVEIAEYIQSSLERRLERKELILGDPSLILRIRDELGEKANGMYLWVYFQLESICEQTTDENIIQTLENLPRDMHETYSRILSRIKRRTALAHKIFETIAVSERPLSTEELREALAIEPGKPILKVGSLVNDISKTLAQCGGSLLVVDEEDSTVRFVHESVRQFFINGIMEDSEIAQYRIAMKKATMDLGLCCVTYLNLGVFNTQLTKARNPAHWKEVSPKKIIKASLPNDSVTARLALSFLRGGKDTDCDITKQLERVAALTNPLTELTHAFLSYAKLYIFTHTKELLKCDSELDSMFYKTFNGYLPFVPKPWTSDDGETLGNNAMLWAVDHDHLGLLDRILRPSASDHQVSHIDDKKVVSGVHRQVLHDLLGRAFIRRKVEVLRFILKTIYLEPEILQGLLYPVIACGDELLEEWTEQGGRIESMEAGPYNSKNNGLKKYEIGLSPRVMRLQNYQIQTVEFETEWNTFAFSAACNNIAAINLVRESVALKSMSKDRILQLLLSGLREAACRGLVPMFKHLLASFPINLYRQIESKVSRDEYDANGWTPLYYAATLPDPGIYQSLRDKYEGSEAYGGIALSPGLVFSLANRHALPLYKFDQTEKEVAPVDVSKKAVEAMWQRVEAESRLTANDRSRRRLFVRRAPKKQTAAEVALLPNAVESNAVESNVVESNAVESNAVELSAEAELTGSLRMLATLSGTFFGGAPQVGPYRSQDKSFDLADRISRRHQAETAPGAGGKVACECCRDLLHLPALDTAIQAPKTKTSSVETTPVDWYVADAKTDGLPTQNMSGRTLREDDAALEPRKDVVPRPRADLRSKENRNNQAVLIRTSQAAANGRPWWENPFLVFVMFVLWPSILVCGMVYALQRPERGFYGNGQCVWDELVDL